VNKLLASVGARDLPASSYRSVKQHYVPYFTREMDRLGAAIESPPTWSDLKKAGALDLPTHVAGDDDPTEGE